MKTYKELLEFYGLKPGKKYRITSTYLRSFMKPKGQLEIGDIFTFTDVPGKEDPQIFSNKKACIFPIYELNFYDYEECKEAVLDAKEKEYLTAVLKPFKKKFKCLIKTSDTTWDDKTYYSISFCIIGIDGGEDWCCFPSFSSEENMYKNLIPGIEYNLKDLGLDE